MGIVNTEDTKLRSVSVMLVVVSTVHAMPYFYAIKIVPR